MATAVRQPLITAVEYLALDRESDVKSEFVDGHIYAMTGASRAHNLIAGNVFRNLANQLDGRPCESYVSDMRVKVSETGLYTYPDVVVVCGEPRFEDEHVDTLLNPTVIIEVLSPSTEAYDRGAKFAHYRRLDSLQEYVLISQDAMRIERFSRQGDVWELNDASLPTDSIQVAAIDCELSLAAVYDRVTVPDESAAERP